MIPILYQSENLIAVEKPSGLLVHAYRKETNERDHLLRRVRDQVGMYLYPIHRLDKPVSGIVLFGLNASIVREIKEVWHLESTLKQYLALVKGALTSPGSFEFDLTNDYQQKQTAITRYEPVQCFQETTLVRVRIETGRKHQIRRHFSRRCANVIGDSKYGQGKWNRLFHEQYNLERIFLHACRLKLTVPSSGEVLDIKSPLPMELEAVLEKLRGSAGE
ncbi:hypothetical protein KKA14_01995 [bacterium]|nr:hypothetical protein [bacterium]